MKLLVFDTETTGLPEKRNSSIYNTNEWPHIVQLSYVIYDMEENTLEIIDDYIDIPENVIITPDSAKIHGITRKICKEKGITIDAALEKFINNLNKSSIIIGHNISFDKRMIMVEGIRNKKQIYMKQIDDYCTMKDSVDICRIEKVNNAGEKYFKYPRLSELHQHYFNTEPKNTHNAIVDVLICFKCFMKMRYNIEITKINREIRSILRSHS